MPDKEHAALVLRRRKRGHPEVPGSCNACNRLWDAASKRSRDKVKQCREIYAIDRDIRQGKLVWLFRLIRTLLPATDIRENEYINCYWTNISMVPPRPILAATAREGMKLYRKLYFPVRI